MLTPSTAEELAAIGVEIESVPCALCGSADATLVTVGHDDRCDTPGAYQVVRCRGCGLLRTSPRPTRRSIHRYYPEDYPDYHRQVAQQPRSVPSWRDRRVRVMPPVAPPGRLLEIGTSFGTFLRQSQLDGWDVTGIEFDAGMAARASALTGAAVHAGSVESVEFPRGSFDVICSWQVVEHLHNPVEAVRRCFEWLKPGGWLAIAVPDAGSVEFRMLREAWYCLDVPRHLYHFSPRTCRAMFESCGFVDVRLVRPRTIYTSLLSATGILERRGVLARGRGQALLRRWPARVLNATAGYFAAPLGLTNTFTMLGRRPV
jgi:SAM-dependent methyltransferase